MYSIKFGQIWQKRAEKGVLQSYLILPVLGHKRLGFLSPIINRQTINTAPSHIHKNGDFRLSFSEMEQIFQRESFIYKRVIHPVDGYLFEDFQQLYKEWQGSQDKRLNQDTHIFLFRVSALAHFLLMETFDHAPHPDVSVYGYSNHYMELLRHIDLNTVKPPIRFCHPRGNLVITNSNDLEDLICEIKDVCQMGNQIAA